MKAMFHLILISLFLVGTTSISKAQISNKPNLDFKVELNNLNQQLEVVWATCLENSVVKLLDNNLNPIKTQTLCKETQGIIDISDLQSDLYYVQVEHYTGIGIQPVVKAAKETNLSTNNAKTLKADLVFDVYPNPSQDEITIQSKDFASNSVVTILDLQGHQVQSRTLNNASSVIDISNLPQGVYFIRIEDEYRIGVQQLVKK
ncbi:MULTISPECIES: T9SS type A sorting domain-containing protein [unclassified Aureispira]|uniref:T9SS type A sorting domain-containing protein n=1 Tax=unclassified Aureispira TaxID=2649989 RepID=UPI0006986379|nr:MULTISPECIES: T9SS type A sorting domain-containing protein [unclassified Aureispira]WMX13545.1 T9SS type A sorting domain-containing protein [Aureispira sp. CCB-E]